MSYSYNPELVSDGGLNQMRFSLGDVFVEEPEKTAYLTDEEILAQLLAQRTFDWARFRLLESLLFRFAYEVDTKADKVEWKLSQRIDFWQSEYHRLRAKLEPEEAAAAVTFGFKGRTNRDAVFSLGMHDWG